VVTPSAGSVILVPFPFSDLSQSKLRPAVALADAARGDWILCQITSKSYSDPQAIELTDDSFDKGSLLRIQHTVVLNVTHQSKLKRRLNAHVHSAAQQLIQADRGLRASHR
jgi:hypothetical protein